jgi:hypothetical protein
MTLFAMTSDCWECAQNQMPTNGPKYQEIDSAYDLFQCPNYVRITRFFINQYRITNEDGVDWPSGRLRVHIKSAIK